MNEYFVKRPFDSRPMVVPATSCENAAKNFMRIALWGLGLTTKECVGMTQKFFVWAKEGDPFRVFQVRVETDGYSIREFLT